MISGSQINFPKEKNTQLYQYMLFAQNAALIVCIATDCGVDESDWALQLHLRRSLHCAPYVTSLLKSVATVGKAVGA
jgi:hypothetical protein